MYLVTKNLTEELGMKHEVLLGKEALAVKFLMEKNK